MITKSVAEINKYVGSSVNPMTTPDQIYELYSVPSFESGSPEIVSGADIGSTKVVVEDGDILICKINPRINRVWVVHHNTEYPLLASSEWIVVRNATMNSDYLKWYFSSPIFHTLLTSQVTGIGGSLTRAQPKQVAKYPVPIPSRDEQDYVANILTCIDNLIRKYQQCIISIDQLVKSRFIEMFGDPKLNPRKWDMVTIGDIATDVRYGTSRPATEGGKYPYLRMNNLTYEGHLDLTDLKHIDIPDNEIEKCVVRNGDVLFNRTNSVELVGKTCVYNLDSDMIIAGYIIRVRIDDRVLPVILSSYLNSTVMKEQLRSMAKGAVNQANINAQELRSISIYLPPITLQHEFATFVEQVDKSKFEIQQSLEKLEILKKSLMQQYFG